MKEYKIQNRIQKNSHSCVPLREINTHRRNRCKMYLFKFCSVLYNLFSVINNSLFVLLRNTAKIRLIKTHAAATNVKKKNNQHFYTYAVLDIDYSDKKPFREGIIIHFCSLLVSIPYIVICICICVRPYKC
jgi:hypothetical protein